MVMLLLSDQAYVVLCNDMATDMECTWCLKAFHSYISVSRDNSKTLQLPAASFGACCCMRGMPIAVLSVTFDEFVLCTRGVQDVIMYTLHLPSTFLEGHDNSAVQGLQMLALHNQ